MAFFVFRNPDRAAVTPDAVSAGGVIAGDILPAVAGTVSEHIGFTPALDRPQLWWAR